jgi:hypothetical protein
MWFFQYKHDIINFSWVLQITCIIIIITLNKAPHTTVWVILIRSYTHRIGPYAYGRTVRSRSYADGPNTRMVQILL